MVYSVATMIFVARARSFLSSIRGKQVLSGLLMAALVLGSTTLPQRVLAQQQAPGTGSTAPSTAPAPTPAARTSSSASSGGVTFSDYQQVWANTSSLTNCTGGGATACIVQAVGLMITFLFSVITYFLSKLLILLTSVLIVFARYNKFNNAPPVKIGWVVIRDIVNMLFIVILLASAFMTIIGQAESKGMHYTKVLPGVITGAILVNFSRTIMLLAIDASQVVTLTFISAFEGSIAGNIFQALGITRMTQLQAQPTTDATQAVISLVNISVAYLLAMFLLMTAVAIILVYVGYFIFRIIGLWMLIILSPIAFVAGSMPKTFGSMFKDLQSEFDKRFSSLLIGGPTIAFFLWLSFATIQRQSATDGLSGADMGFDVPADSAVLGFITQIGTTGDIAGFIVAVVLLSIGFSVATKTANSVSPLMESVTKKVSGYRGAAFNFASRLPLRGATGAASFANQRFGLTNKVAQGIARGAGGLRTQGALQGAGGLVGRAINLVPGVGGQWAGAAAAATAAVGAGSYAATRKKADERIKALDSLPPTERIAAIRALDGGPGSNGKYGSMTYRATAEAQHEALVKNRDADLKARQSLEADRIKAEILKANPSAKIDDEEVKRQAKAVATQQLANDEAARAKRLQDFAKDANDTEALEKWKKEDKKFMRYEDAKDYNKRVGELLGDTDGIKDLDASVVNSGRFAMEMLTQANAVKKGENGKLQVDKPLLKALTESDGIKNNKSLVETLKATANLVDGGASEEAIRTGVKQEDGYGTARLYAVSKGPGDTLTSAPIYSQKELTAIDSLRGAGVESRAAGSALSEAQKTAISNALEGGLPIAQIRGMVDKEADGKSDQAFFKQAAEIAKKTIEDSGVSGEEALKKIEKMLSAARDLKVDSDLSRGILEQAFATEENVKKLFNGFYAPSADKKAAGSLLAYAADASKKSALINDRMEYAREEFFPEAKKKIVIGTKPVTVEKTVVDEENVVNDGIELVDAKGEAVKKKVTKVIKVQEMQEVTKELQAPSYINRIFNGMKSDYDT